MKLNELKHPANGLPNDLDGFSVVIDAERQRADVILNRPPLNVIQMAQREQLRVVFEALDADDRVRVIVLRSEGEHFSSGGDRSLRGIWPHRHVAENP
jgi:2-oxoglutaroyl-CoA hydrolase